ncbi:MAG: acylphosphatase [Phycisphaerae bacterium]|nr:acylphosphatase [Gemmatimonadaceae bacterium]
MTPPPDQQVRHLLIVGRVQGVGFRWFSRERARRRGLSGWVQNRSDGSVEIMVAGSSEVLDNFVEELLRGPDGATVDRVQALGEPHDFRPEHPLPYPFQIIKQQPS